MQWDVFERLGTMLASWATAIISALGLCRVKKIHETADELKARLLKEKKGRR